MPARTTMRRKPFELQERSFTAAEPLPMDNEPLQAPTQSNELFGPPPNLFRVRMNDSNGDTSLAEFQEQSDLDIPDLPPADAPFQDLTVPRGNSNPAKPQSSPSQDALPPLDNLPPPLNDAAGAAELPEPQDNLSTPDLESPFDPSDAPMTPNSEGYDLDDLDPFDDPQQPSPQDNIRQPKPQDSIRQPDAGTPPEPQDSLPDFDDEFEFTPDDEPQLPSPMSEGFEEADEDGFDPTPPLRDNMFDESDDEQQDEVDSDVDDEDEEDENSQEDSVPCDRKYNDRNCCREDRECVAVLERLKERNTRSISLDIAPPLVVESAVEVEESAAESRTKQLDKIPWRSWTGRHGEALGSGQLAGFRDGRIYVRSDEGSTIPIPFNRLSRDDLCFVSAYWNLPAECPLPGDTYSIRDFTMLSYSWTASGQCHKPLYFENVALERYGHSAGPIKQHFWSAAHFFASAAFLPYNMGVYPATECRYALGYYEPGDCAPWMIHAFPLSKRGALSELAFVLGFWGIVQ